MARGARSFDWHTSEKLRFPCGHHEIARWVVQRLKNRGEAAWVVCARCNVIALVIHRKKPLGGGAATPAPGPCHSEA